MDSVSRIGSLYSLIGTVFYGWDGRNFLKKGRPGLSGGLTGTGWKVVCFIRMWLKNNKQEQNHQKNQQDEKQYLDPLRTRVLPGCRHTPAFVDINLRR